MPKRQPAVTAALIETYLTHLREQERSAATLRKYAHDLKELCVYLQNTPLTKAALIAWKEQLGAYGQLHAYRRQRVSALLCLG